MEELGRRREVADGQVDPGSDDRVGGRDVQVVDGSPVRVDGEPGQERDQQGREDGPDEVRQPAAPADHRADEAGKDTAERAVHEHVEVLGLTEHPASVVDGEGQDDAHQQDEQEGDPALRR